MEEGRRVFRLQEPQHDLVVGPAEPAVERQREELRPAEIIGMRKRGGENLRRIVPGTGISHYGLDARQKSALFGHGGEAPQRELRRSVVDDANDEIGHFACAGSTIALKGSWSQRGGRLQKTDE
jgi:hypothetical protein